MKFVKNLIMRIKTNKRGLTLIEVMIVALIIAVAVIGAISFRFFGVTNAKKADVQANAARIGSMMLETWNSLGDVPDDPLLIPPYISVYEDSVKRSFGYNPGSTLQLTLSPATSGPAATLINVLKRYEVQDLANCVYYFVTLSYKPAVTGSEPEPQAINASISWNRGYGLSGTTEHITSISNYVN